MYMFKTELKREARERAKKTVYVCMRLSCRQSRILHGDERGGEEMEPRSGSSKVSDAQ